MECVMRACYLNQPGQSTSWSVPCQSFGWPLLIHPDRNDVTRPPGRGFAMSGSVAGQRIDFPRPTSGKMLRYPPLANVP